MLALCQELGSVQAKKQDHKVSLLRGSFRNYWLWHFPGGPVVKNRLAMQWTRVRSLVRVLGSHMPLSI